MSWFGDDRSSGDSSIHTTSSLVASHQEITLHAPTLTPRILDNPVFAGIRDTPSHNEDRMIQISGGTTRGRTKNTTAVVLQIGGVNQHRQWTSREQLAGNQGFVVGDSSPAHHMSHYVQFALARGTRLVAIIGIRAA
eukprot:TRINITY_DN5140_c0_g1_i6.p1 TRINITY_DN5140_c0_g1~~TRINITY_DN5140_c0_g1_i6.p1  ORF type:complete len:137 (-),score=1.92 TRINITY_DN5140_c0_g1_i6:514-924(-)